MINCVSGSITKQPVRSHQRSPVLRFIQKSPHFNLINSVKKNRCHNFTIPNKPYMKKTFFALSAIAALIIFSGCQDASPEKYFGLAVLNSNLIVGFASDGFQRELDQPSMMLVEGTSNATKPMKRKDVVNTKIRFVEDNLTKLKKLKQTPDTEDILQASIQLHEFILPVYKNEYQSLALLYDDGANNDTIRNTADAIHDKYSAGFEEKYNSLINSGKNFATKHKITVNWGR
jgi:hypothetical protein